MNKQLTNSGKIFLSFNYYSIHNNILPNLYLKKESNWIDCLVENAETARIATAAAEMIGMEMTKAIST